MSYFKLLIFFCCVFCTLETLAAPATVQGDSTVTSYWRNGQKKTEFVYKVKHRKTKEGLKVIVLETPKQKRFYTPDGEETTEELFRFSYKIDNAIDSLAYTRRPHKAEFMPDARLCFQLGTSGSCLYMNLVNDSTTRYREADTLISNTRYTILVYEVNRQGTKRLSGALRTSGLQLYYYNLVTGTETLNLDLKNTMSELGNEILKGTEVFLQTGIGFSRALGQGATRLLGRTLANLILISKP
jgi:hypothetical protein